MSTPEKEFVGFFRGIFLLDLRSKWDLSGESFEGKVFLILIMVVGREGIGAWEWGWGDVVVAQRRDTVWGSPTAGWRVILVNIILAKIVTFTIRRPDRSIMSG